MSCLMDLGHNAAGAPRAGNASFRQCWRGPDATTGGCVAVSEEKLQDISSETMPTRASAWFLRG